MCHRFAQFERGPAGCIKLVSIVDIHDLDIAGRVQVLRRELQHLHQNIDHEGCVRCLEERDLFARVLDLLIHLRRETGAALQERFVVSKANIKHIHRDICAGKIHNQIALVDHRIQVVIYHNSADLRSDVISAFRADRADHFNVRTLHSLFQN